MNLSRRLTSRIGLLALLFLWASSVGAQSPAHAKPKSKPSSSPSKSRASALDAAAALQAQAMAEAAAKKTPPMAPAAVLAAPALAALPAAAAEPATSLATEVPLLTPSPSPEILIAQQIHQGQLPCELGATVRIEADPSQAGAFHVQGKGFKYRMFPVQTSTGTLRLEDKKAGAVWLQLANKSMLMDQKRGRRIVDDCVHP
ncbi:MAG: hypothetical protein ACK5BY_07015, partial [Limnohabitans sp.]